MRDMGEWCNSSHSCTIYAGLATRALLLYCLPYGRNAERWTMKCPHSALLELVTSTPCLSHTCASSMSFGHFARFTFSNVAAHDFFLPSLFSFSFPAFFSPFAASPDFAPSAPSFFSPSAPSTFFASPFTPPSALPSFSSCDCLF